MNAARVIVILAFVLILGVPLAFRPAAAPGSTSADARLVIITPHNEQIRYEFGRAFSEWYSARHEGKTVAIDWRQPGGTSDIVKVLRATYSRAIAEGRIVPSDDPNAPARTPMLAPGREPMPYDLMFGGGSYDHGVEVHSNGASATLPGATEPISLSMSVPAGLTADELNEVFAIRDASGELVAIGDAANVVSDKPRPESLRPSEHRLYDPDQFWVGTALSGFGIVYNRDALRALGVDEPRDWHDITDPRLSGQLAAADPRMSGSVTTTYESILNNFGWDEGWKLLRRISANARYFSGSSARPPVDVSQGEAAVGLAIDFYGRYQAQAVRRSGETAETSRVGYVDPAGAAYIDADPISILAGTHDPELCREFLRFVLSDEGQALWNFQKREDASSASLGPERYELRRMPVRRTLYTEYPGLFVDKANPYALNAPIPTRGWRSAITPMMTAFALDIHEEQNRAWEALTRAKELAPDDPRISEMEGLFDAFPEHEFMTDLDKFGVHAGDRLPFNEANYQAIKADWRAAQARGVGEEIRVRYTAFFRSNYHRIISAAGQIGR